ncbi:potassium uptake protein, TrkH family [Georgenia satyanarayanai]|uniref:Potassium uptake protein, TrkH family n=1 Tax=Georgenia satyanarayanai TaxID=860221 RepID=A0A2Y9ARP2_9MICO|nr:potassium transporter TrkG [Georgenia satyanarayanai]PYF98292.1 potassium uptake TrkH family protein [Georgenia satyanarayanai]SSA45177.1 potassium uptake protein, TrkH family [Georgenia satyanarayanai]
MPLTGRTRPPFRRLRSAHPAQAIVAAYAAALAAGTVLLLLPVSVTEEAGGRAGLVEALFTAGSAVSVTGLVVVDTATYWSSFGHVVIFLLIELGGLGLMTFASLLGLLLVHRLGLRTRLVTSASIGTPSGQDLRGVVVGVATIALIVQAATAVVLAARLALAHDYPPGRALWHGIFHAGSAFNNAGFALYSDNLMGFVADPWVCLPIAVAVILGGIGFPVFLELSRHVRVPRLWSMNTRIVLVGTAVLLVGATVTITALEWDNPGTLGPLDAPAKLLAGFFAAVVARTAGFNTLDVAEMNTQTWFAQDVLMFIGAGPAGTAGGIKITTAAVLVAIVLAEIRGEGAVTVFGKRLSRAVHRQAITVLSLGVAVVMGGTWVLLITTEFTLDQIVFEVISAFATVGLSTGITHLLPDGGQLLLVVIMFAGRVGPVTLATALALRPRTRLYELPKERPLIG